jgi:Uma2 family endonuclease
MTLAPPIAKAEKPFVEPVYAYDKEGYLIADGLSMAETEAHFYEMVHCIESLIARYADTPDIVVSGNNFVHYREGDRKRHIAPDCYVVKGVSKRLRDNFKIWEEGASPCVIFEFTSGDTHRVDTGPKLRLYEQTLQTAEYFLFDPKSEFLSPPLQGYRLHEGRYERIEPDAQGRLWSNELGLWLERRGENLRFFDPMRGEYLRTPAEAERERLQEKARADAEASARAELEAELARVRAELEMLRQQKQDGTDDVSQ